MREKWIVETKKGDFNGLSAKLKVSPLAVRCLMNRGVESEQEMREFLYGTLDDSCRILDIIKRSRWKVKFNLKIVCVKCSLALFCFL